jgi:phosphoglycolate phosphatase-like HAD superfamily hydrolase
MLKKYLLFDIDGTLVNTGGAGLKAMKSTVKSILGNEELLKDYSFAGKTDSQIMNDMVRRSGLDDNPETLSKLLEQTYIEKLKTNLKNSGNFRTYPNVNELLDNYQNKEDYELALLTGNFETGAKLKLEHAGLWKYFKWGVFGNLSEDRVHLAKDALETITEKEKMVNTKNIFIIGDTTNDIRCGKAIDATTIAFTSGFEPEEKLRNCSPDFMVSDFSQLYDIFNSNN